VPVEPAPRLAGAIEQVVDQEQQVRLSAALQPFEEKEAGRAGPLAEALIEEAYHLADVGGGVRQTEEQLRLAFETPAAGLPQVGEVDDALDFARQRLGARSQVRGIAHISKGARWHL
jgi:hypothetical protein